MCLVNGNGSNGPPPDDDEVVTYSNPLSEFERQFEESLMTPPTEEEPREEGD